MFAGVRLRFGSDGADRTDRRDVQRLRLHRRAPPGVHGREPERHDRAQQGGDVERRSRELLPEARQDSGLADVEAIEVDWLPEVMQYSDLLAEVPSGTADRWLDWKVDAATDADGRLIGYGTDIGPEGVCYRSDLFAAAGLPTDRDEVAALLEGDWDQVLRGRRAVHRRDRQGVVRLGRRHLPGHDQPGRGRLRGPRRTVTSSPPRTPRSRTSTTRCSTPAPTQSAHLGQWSDDWFAGLSNGAYATMLCPGWMLGVISGNAEGVTGWDVANVFPERRRQLGRLVPDRSRQRRERRGGAEARRLADRSRAADQGVRQRGHLPEPGRGLHRRGAHRLRQRVLQQRPGRRRSSRTAPRPSRSRRSRARTTSRSTTPCRRR